MYGTVATTVLILCVASPVLAKGGNGKDPAAKQQRAAAKAQQKAAKQQQHAAAKQQHAAAKQQHAVAKQQHAAAKQQRAAAKQQRAAAKQQRAAAKQQRAAAKGRGAPASPRAKHGSGSAAARSVAVVASPKGKPASRAARRRALHRAALRRRAAHRAALRRRAAHRAALRRRAATRPAAAVVAPAAAVIGASQSGGSTPVAAATPESPAKKPAAKKQAARKRLRTAPAHDRGPVTVVTHTVSDIAHVIPGWAKAIMAALFALLAIAGLLILGAALRNRRLRALSTRLLDEVGTLSAALLPIVPPRVGTLAVSAAYRPAAGLAAGGDFYDVFPLDRGRVGIVVGDVSGHGRESLGPATFIRHMVRSYLEAGLVPRAALQLAGKVVDEHRREDFATVIAAVHDPSAGTFSYATAGHPPPIISGPGEHRPLTVASSPPIGVGSPTGLRQTTIPVAPGTTICFFTDGLMEARREGRQYGMPRLERTVRELEPDATAEQLVARVGREVDSLPDDVAACLVRVEGGAQMASTLRVEEIEVTRAELTGERLRRFLEACGIAHEDVPGVIKAAKPRAVKYGSIVLRVRLADDRSGVDILPVEGGAPGAELAALRRIG